LFWALNRTLSENQYNVTMDPSLTEGAEMELLLTLTIFVVALTALGALAAIAGTDSRESIGDDWARPTHA
jgi:hypothetical protein